MNLNDLNGKEVLVRLVKAEKFYAWNFLPYSEPKASLDCLEVIGKINQDGLNPKFDKSKFIHLEFISDYPFKNSSCALDISSDEIIQIWGYDKEGKQTLVFKQ